MKNGKGVIRIIGVIFSVIGVVALIATIILLTNTIKFSSNADEVTATITSIEYGRVHGRLQRDVYVSYTYEGAQYDDVYLNYYSYNMREGGEIKILVDREYPTYIASKFSMIIFVLPAILALVFGGIGFTFLFASRSNNKKKEYLMENGRVLHGVVELIDFNWNLTVNGIHPYLVYCQYNDMGTGTVYKFKSENLYFDPNQYYNIGDSIDIYVDPNNYRKYFVDVRQYSGTANVVNYT